MLQVGVDSVVVEPGWKPNTELAESSNLPLHDTLGGIIVDNKLQASPDIYVVSSCNVVLGRPR